MSESLRCIHVRNVTPWRRKDGHWSFIWRCLTKNDLSNSRKLPHPNHHTATSQTAIAFVLNAECQARKIQLSLLQSWVWSDPGLILNLLVPKQTLYKKALSGPVCTCMFCCIHTWSVVYRYVLLCCVHSCSVVNMHILLLTCMFCCEHVCSVVNMYVLLCKMFVEYFGFHSRCSFDMTGDV